MTGTASLAWFAHHEFRLAWRDWLSMLTAGKRRRARVVALAFLAFISMKSPGNGTTRWRG